MEWAKIRTPPSFAKQTLYWEQRKFQSSSACKKTSAVKTFHFIGSSQTAQSTDIELICKKFKQGYFEMNWLNAFEPIEYQFLWSRISERNPDVIVCWLSEFDFYRGSEIHVNRLRWAADTQSVATLTQQLDCPLLWDSRGKVADLSMSACLPLWRNRDHIRRVIFNYWWKSLKTKREENAFLKGIRFIRKKEFLEKAVHDSRMLEVNFQCFEQFAQSCKDSKVDLIVFEGQSNPVAMKVYNPSYRVDTRKRLKEMSQSCGFQYYDQRKIPRFSGEEFLDATHLNEQGRNRWSNFLAKTLLIHTENHQ